MFGYNEIEWTFVYVASGIHSLDQLDHNPRHVEDLYLSLSFIFIIIHCVQKIGTQSIYVCYIMVHIRHILEGVLYISYVPTYHKPFRVGNRLILHSHSFHHSNQDGSKMHRGQMMMMMVVAMMMVRFSNAPFQNDHL